MSQSQQIPVRGLPAHKAAIIALAAIFAVGLFLVGFDQGETLSLLYGQNAYADMLFHEFTHDMRHAAGFPCH